ncbi:MAG TPA: hypothetical protein VK196_06600 [Magnetospirillum sp.]|nr:hypothetical protein [Magnetospirillum sp.]
MKRVLIAMGCLAAAWTAQARAEDTRDWQFGGTRVTIERNGEDERLTVRRDGTAPVVLDEHRFSPRAPVGQNVTGDGQPQLVVTGWSGGAHCCHTVHIIDLGEQPRLIQSIDAGHSDLDLFAQLDDDAALEIALPDWTYAYWPGSFALSPVPHVVLEWDGRQYTPSARLTRNGSMYYRMQDEQMQNRRQPTSPEEQVAAIFQDTLDMVYAGRMKAARTLLKQLLPPTPENKQLQQVLFDCKLPSSPWWPFVAGLNGVPPKPPAATCPSNIKG